MAAHNEEALAVIQALQSDQTKGLSEKQVKEKQAQHGENKLREKKRRTNLQRFAEQFKDVMILILLAAAMISLAIAFVEKDPKSFFEPALILLIVILNAIMGVMQESRAEKALDALKNMSAPHARVIRDGEEKVIDAKELVPGDIIHLEAGDFVPADARLIRSASLKSEESALTGESVPSEKDAEAAVKENAPIGDRNNMVFSGCSITYGTATAVVTATGMDTEMGKIANLLDNEEDGQTPLQRKLAELGKYLGILALAACAIIFVIGAANGIPTIEIFMTAVSLAVSAIPEGLPALVVPPAHLVRNWQEEARRFLRVNGGQPRIHVIRGLKPYQLPEADLYIMHYHLLRGWKELMRDFPVETVVFDEAQELRHAGTEKYSAASLLSEGARRVFGLSGTPIYNRGGEIWNVVNILDYHFLGDWDSFSREWCYGYGNAVVIKPDLLGDYLKREGMMLQRTKEAVLHELPPKRRLVQELDWNDKLYAKLMAPILPALERWRTDRELTASQRAILGEDISQHARQATGLAKAPYVCQFVRMLLDNGEKVLLFAHHHSVMDSYRSELKSYSPGFVTGRETQNAKEQAVARFMEGRTDLLCVSLRAASGLNLQRATCVVFGELDWSPAVHSQAEDRAHRIGQADSLLCYYLVSPQGSDLEMQEALGLKVSQFVGLMGDKPPTEEQALSQAQEARSYIERLIRRLGDNEGSGSEGENQA